MKPLSCILLCLIFITLQISAQDFNEIHRRIKIATENREYQTAIGELETLKKDNQKIFELNNYDYLLARLAEKQGDAAAAMANYEAAARRNSVLSEYALWHLSQIYRASGNLLMERIYLQKIGAIAPDSLLLKAINQRLPRSFYESKDYEATIGLLNNPPRSSGQRSAVSVQTVLTVQSRENSVLLGQAFMQSGKLNEAKEIFTRLIADLPNAGQPDDYALTALKTLDEMTFGAELSADKLPPLTDYELLRRAQIYQFNRDFPRARFYFQAIIEKFPASGITPDALFQVGRSYAQEKKFDEAIRWFERVQAEFPAHPIAKDALSQTAAAYARVNKPKEAVARYQKFIAQFPDAETLDRAYLNIVDIYRDTGANADALKWTRKTQEAFRGKTPEAVALFAQTRIHIAQNDWTDALNDLENLAKLPDLGGTRVPGGTNEAEITFLKGFALENLNRYAEAIDVYLSIPDGRNEYYGWRATERLKNLNADEKAKNYIEEAVKKNLFIADEKILLDTAERSRSIGKMREAAQNILRLTNDSQYLSKVNKIILYAYFNQPDYQYIRTVSFDDRAKQCHLQYETNLVGAPAPNYSQKMYGRCEVRFEQGTAKPKRTGHFVNAEELIFLGLYDEAALELAFAFGANSSTANLSKEDAATVALAFKRGDLAYKAVAFAEPMWRKVPADYLIEMAPREAIELLYPAPYADSLLKYSPERAVDPRFLLSIMRQESRFRPDVKSNAAARGLMQFISTTANQIAGELNRENFVQDELYNPPTAILFGSQYVGNLFKLFPSQPAAVAASYNGGEDNVGRWLARAKTTDADRYVPEIVFTQSKDYVYKVLAADRVYRMIYDENLRAR